MLTNDIVSFEQLGPRMLYLQNDKLNFTVTLKNAGFYLKLKKGFSFSLYFHILINSRLIRKQKLTD